MSECENCEILKQDVENLADLLLKLRLKVSQIGVDVNRAATKCVASTEFVTAVGNTLDDIGSLQTCSLQLEKDDNAEKIEDENILLNDLKSYVKGGTYAP